MIEGDVYVACLVLRGRRAVVVGTGAMAAEKVTGLRECGATVTQVAPSDYSGEVLEGALLVVAATSDADLNRRVFEDAEARRMLVNVADVPELCNFILPAIVRKPPVTIAVATQGASPALAKRIKREIEERFGEEYSRLAELLDEVRPWARDHLDTYEERRDFFDGIVGGAPDPIELLRDGDEAGVRALILQAQRDVAAG